MHESSHTPPSLCYSPSVSDSRRESTDNTPLSTPTVEQAPWPPTSGQPKKEKDLYFSWHRKTGAEKRSSNPLLGSDWHFAHHSEESLFEDDGDGDIAFPLFPDSPPRSNTATMGSSVAPVDISLPPRMSSNSQSPRNQTSNLTFALQEAGATGQAAPEAFNGRPLAIPEAGRLGFGGRQDSLSSVLGSSYYNGTGAKPISVKDRNRRESNTTGSFMNGMSWGGISVGSFIRDE
jgi:transcription factor SFP1